MCVLMSKCKLYPWITKTAGFPKCSQTMRYCEWLHYKIHNNSCFRFMKVYILMLSSNPKQKTMFYTMNVYVSYEKNLFAIKDF